MKRPVILGVAVTNKPHVRLREHPLAVVNKEWFSTKGVKAPREIQEDEELIRVPFLVKGKYNHPLGALDFTEESFDKMLQNHESNVGDFSPSLDAKHRADVSGALAWFDGDGWIAKEGNLLVGYGKPTSDKALNLVKNKEFRYASVEFHPNYRSNVAKTYLSDDFEEVNMDELEQLKAEVEALKAKLEESKTAIAAAESAAETKVSEAEAAAQAKVEALEAKVSELEATIKLSTEGEEEDEATKALNARIMALEKANVEKDVELVIEKAAKGVDGKSLPAVALNLAKALMLGDSVGEGDDVIKLEDASDVGAVGEYYRRGIAKFVLSLPEHMILSVGETTPADKPADKEAMREAGKKVGKTMYSGGDNG